MEDFNDNISVYAIDKALNVVTIEIPYVNLQWTRRYYDFGEFAIQVPIGVYDPSWMYICSNEREEVGVIHKIDKASDSDDLIQLSGFFAEYLLNDKVCYPRFKQSSAKAEKIIRDIFTKYREDLIVELGAANNPLLGSSYQSNFSDDQMGNKFYNICEPDEMSYRVYYDYDRQKLLLKVWQGLDRTQSQSVNEFQVFSLEFGNIAKYAMTLDTSAYKNYAIIPCNADDNGAEQNVYYIDYSNGGYKRKIVLDHRADTLEEDETLAQFKERVLNDATTEMLSYQVVQDIEVAPASAERYMVDYDLGDKCDVLFTDIGVTSEARIVEIYEVFKAEGHELTIGLGNKRISNIRRAATTL